MSRPLVYGALSLVALLVGATLGFALLGPVGAVLFGVGGPVVLFVTWGETSEREPTPEVRPGERDGENGGS
ncbi:hypothetical protein J2752_002902 [Halarchaeum rubridurum]|uniref:Uncharacterized protein n=1 Tax=Halarchaeum rubridurum TaxID=489911 RepID=A0A830G5X8_9EURY|nr:hypothetical protein [Halarchaeum rubridurum]MBP1955971.1 hypothetical protein [Halarchaeum rubridurum]GGM76370.1 hypothetical protein GCM10009017_27740 [Halarchaeum rubridurum]